MKKTLIKWEEPILMGGSPSSGSTLMSVLLDTHPDVLCGPELSLFSHPFFWTAEGVKWKERLLRYLPLGYSVIKLNEWELDNGVCPYTQLVYDNTLPWYGMSRDKLIGLVKLSSSARELIQHIYTDVLQSRNKRIWADKSPPNLYSFGAFLDFFPKGKVVYLVRDGRDVVCSLMRRGFGFKRALSIWLVETAICETYNNHPRAFRVKYEDIVLNPRGTLQDMFEFLDITPEVDRVLKYMEYSERVHSDESIRGYPSWRLNPRQPISANSIGAWKKVLKPEHLLTFTSAYIALTVPNYNIQGQTASELLTKLAYDPIETLRVNSRKFREFSNKEKLFLSGHDYTNPIIFQERYVEVDINKLPKSEFSWDFQRVFSKITNISAELSLLLQKQDAVLQKQDAVLQKQDAVLQKQDAVLQKQYQISNVSLIRWLSVNMRNKRMLILGVGAGILLVALNAAVSLLLVYLFLR